MLLYVVLYQERLVLPLIPYFTFWDRSQGELSRMTKIHKYFCLGSWVAGGIIIIIMLAASWIAFLRGNGFIYLHHNSLYLPGYYMADPSLPVVGCYPG